MVLKKDGANKLISYPFLLGTKKYALNQYNKLLSIDRKCAMRPDAIFPGNYFIYFMLRNKEINAECK